MYNVRIVIVFLTAAAMAATASAQEPTQASASLTVSAIVQPSCIVTSTLVSLGLASLEVTCHPSALMRARVNGGSLSAERGTPSTARVEVRNGSLLQIDF
jgi:hypothetical protein